MATIAIFGGSFNPVHAGHVLAATYVAQAAAVDAVWVLPVWRHALDKAIGVDFETRLQLCRIGFAVLGDRVQVRDDERGGTGRTIDLVRDLGLRYPDHAFRLMVGSDILAEVHRWHRFDDLARLAPPLLLLRGGFAVPATCPYQVLPIALPDVRSSELRARLAKGESVAGWVPDAVGCAIRERGLYREAAAP
ncbi:MAG: nicotinate (nicotinamide) nucleotide adenylyltransferase [Deltaproteobacteria bacterium]|nr:nicotinate (nicotinamide) nucleotide adenylyltransferase [Deltaproteobacteria bacterium]